MASDTTFMQRALELARRAPFTSPNPRVGAVVVRDGEIVGEGYHLGAGRRHAEIAALEGIDARGATLYVNLEPCSHHGLTPPCAPAVADAGIARVVAAMDDPDAKVSGSGFSLLRQRGVQVEVGMLEADARRLNAPYLWQRTTGRPLVSLKLALTLDGRLAAADRSSKWITGAETRRRVHERRSAVDAVIVGAGTILADDPELTARDVGAARQPVAVLVDSSGSIEPGARALTGPGGAMIATTAASSHERQTEWKEAGADVLVLSQQGEGVALNELLDHLGRHGFLEVLCEGGAGLATSLLRSELVQRLDLHYGPVLTGAGPGIGDLGVATLSAAPRWRTRTVGRSGDDAVVQLESVELARLLEPHEVD